MPKIEKSPAALLRHFRFPMPFNARLKNNDFFYVRTRNNPPENVKKIVHLLHGTIFLQENAENPMYVANIVCLAALNNEFLDFGARIFLKIHRRIISWK